MRSVIPTIDWIRQADYFGEGAGMATLPKRTASTGFPQLSLGVVRNHPVELTFRLCQRYAHYLGIDLQVEYSLYDDSFAFAQPRSTLNSLIVWPDWRRVPAAAVDSVLENVIRIAESNPRSMVVLAYPTDHSGDEGERINQTLKSLSTVRVLEPPPRSQGSNVHKTKMWSGSEYSLEAQYALARRIVVGWLPSWLLPDLKLVAVDLDNTLYRGVLGEEGPDGVIFEQGHVGLLRVLKELQDRGILVAIVTKNDPRDIAGLEHVWPVDGFQLRDAASVVANWGSKGDAIADLRTQWGVAADSAILIDDNPGELIDAVTCNPGIWPVHARDAEEARQILALQPERVAFGVDTTEGMRLRDMQSAERRREVTRNSPSPVELHRRLGTHITSNSASPADMRRVADLLHRTNQFNMSLRRTSIWDLTNESAAAPVLVAIASVADSLSDSGVVAAMVATSTEHSLYISELVISCRVLGRHLESLLVTSLLGCFPEFPDRSGVWIEVTHGPRNSPAIDWLSTVCVDPIPEGGGPVLLSKMLLEASSPGIASVVEVTSNGKGLTHAG